MSRTPSRPAAASNQRPMLEVGGQRSPRANICATAPAAGRWPKRESICVPRPRPCNAAAAMRQGSRAATSPPGRAIGARWPSRRQVAPSTCSNSPPQAPPSVPRPMPSSARPSSGPCTPCSAATAAMCAWWCCTACSGSERCAANSSAKRVLKKSGCRSCATACGRTSSTAHRCSTISTSALQVAALSRSPTCGDRKASSPRVMHTVFFSHAPVASSGGPARGSLIGHGV